MADTTYTVVRVEAETLKQLDRLRSIFRESGSVQPGRNHIIGHDKIIQRLITLYWSHRARSTRAKKAIRYTIARPLINAIDALLAKETNADQ